MDLRGGDHGPTRLVQQGYRHAAGQEGSLLGGHA